MNTTETLNKLEKAFPKAFYINFTWSHYRRIDEGQYRIGLDGKEYKIGYNQNIDEAIERIRKCHRNS